MGTVGNIAAAAQQAAGSGTTNGLTSLAGNFNTFLTLLTTQLKNQDPTNPVDSNQFTQQLVEFASVQQQVETNTLLKQLVANSQASQVGTASSFVGTNIQASGNQGALVNGAAQFGYTLTGSATTVNVTITDANNDIVFSGTGPGKVGNNFVTWDGTNSSTGTRMPDGGIYTIKVTATDSAGNAVTATPFETGTVTSASISNGSVILNIGALQIPQSSVTTVTNLSNNQQASSSTTSGS